MAPASRGTYALATNLNATGTTYTQALIGTAAAASRNRSLPGGSTGSATPSPASPSARQAPTMSGCSVIVTSATASVSNIGLVGGSVIGQENIGSLVAYLDAGVVQTSFSSAAVTGTGGNTGGLIGFINVGTVQSSYATGAVTGSSSTGGLVGEAVLSSTITNSYATGAVSGVQFTGGLVGFSGGTVSGSYATGVVTGTGTSADTGGLIGYNQSGSVNASYASGAVSSSGNFAGGLIGTNAGNVDGSYATGAVTGNSGTGGLIGSHQAAQ